MTTTALHDRAALIDIGLRAAIRAPSPHNTQPWLFEVSADRVVILLDWDRVLRVADADAREARLSCGAALFNLRMALRALGANPDVSLLPGLGRPDVVAEVRLGPRRAPDAAERVLAAAIPKRRTNRRPFEETSVSATHRNELISAAETEGAILSLVGASERFGTIAALIRRADEILAADHAYVAETERWMRHHRGPTDGVPSSAAGPPPENDPALAMRRYHAERSVPPKPFERQPLVAVLLTRGDSPRKQIMAGQAMQRVLLAAAAAGLSASFLSQPIEVAQTKSALDRVFAPDGVPQTILRIGHGGPCPETPRRPVSDVTAYFTDDRGERHD